MELQILISLLISFVAFLIYLFTKLRSSNKNLPPQPWKLPIIGHLHHLAGADPHRALGNLAQKFGPIIHLKLGEISAIVISSPAFAKEIMKTHDLNFATRPNLLSAEILAYNYKGIVFAPYGDYWRQIRKLCVLELLSAKKVHSFQAVREQESWNLIESIGEIASSGHDLMGSKTTVNLSDKIFKMTNAITLRVIVGSKCKDQAVLLALIKEIVSLSSGFDLSDLYPSLPILHLVTGMKKKLIKIHHKMDIIVEAIISDHQERRAAGTSDQNNEDLLEVLLRLKDDGGLQFPITSENVKAILTDMFVGGSDTSSATIEWAMFELMKNPRVMKKAQAELRKVFEGKKKIYESDIQELDYFKLVIKETLRLHPPVPLLVPRESREKCEVGGYTIPANTKVIINGWKIGRDPDYWVDPESFIPERFSEKSVSMMGTDFHYLPFGAGRRMCPGISLGLANVELPLAKLLYYFNWELPSQITTESLDKTETFGATLQLKNNLHLIPSAYNTN